MPDQQEISGHDLIEAGLPPGPGFGQALKFANDALQGGQSWASIRKEVLELFSRKVIQKIGLKDELLVSSATTPESAEEEKNLAASLKGITELSRVPVVDIATLLPDHCPTGSEWGCMPVGGAIATLDSIIPAAHSADINCGMHATFFKGSQPVPELMRHLRHSTLFGPYPMPNGSEIQHPVLKENVWSNAFLKGLEAQALQCLGTQGDGNHFAYLGALEVLPSLVRQLDSSGHYGQSRALSSHLGSTLQVLVTHHGSRNFGARVYKRGLDAAVRFTSEIAEKIPKAGAWLDLATPEGTQYWDALEYVSKWTVANHEVIHKKFLHAIGSSAVTQISNHHNAVWRHQNRIYHGKGATPAWKDAQGRPRLGIIPLNMGREILLVEGLDNQQFLSFAPHGAGRNQSRTSVKRAFADSTTGDMSTADVQQAIAQLTPGVLVEWASGKPDISESPLGYKSASKVKQEIAQFRLATVIAEISPRGCIMAGDIDRPWKKKPNMATP